MYWISILLMLISALAIPVAIFLIGLSIFDSGLNNKIVFNIISLFVCLLIFISSTMVANSIFKKNNPTIIIDESAKTNPELKEITDGVYYATLINLRLSKRQNIEYYKFSNGNYLYYYGFFDTSFTGEIERNDNLYIIKNDEYQFFKTLNYLDNGVFADIDFCVENIEIPDSDYFSASIPDATNSDNWNHVWNFYRNGTVEYINQNPNEECIRRGKYVRENNIISISAVSLTNSSDYLFQNFYYDSENKILYEKIYKLSDQ